MFRMFFAGVRAWSHRNQAQYPHQELHTLSVHDLTLHTYPPTGKVRISAPLRMDLDTIRIFAITKLGWIKSQQQKLREQERETSREYLDRESHYVWGKRQA